MAKSKKKRLSALDKEFIRRHCDTMNDEELADRFSCHVNTIANARKEFGIKKNRGGVESIDPTKSDGKEDVVYEDAELATFYREEFLTSSRGKRIRDQLEPEDWDFFIEEWINFHLQLEDLKHTEEDIVEQIIFYKIRIYKNQYSLKECQRTKKKLSEKYGPMEQLDFDDEEQAQIYQQMLHLEGRLSDINKEYINFADHVDKLYKGLNATREQREKSGKVGADTFFKLIKQFEDRKFKKKAGRDAALLRFATDHKKEKMKEVIQFGDDDFGPQFLSGDNNE